MVFHALGSALCLQIKKLGDHSDRLSATNHTPIQSDTNRVPSSETHRIASSSASRPKLCIELLSMIYLAPKYLHIPLGFQTVFSAFRGQSRKGLSVKLLHCHMLSLCMGNLRELSANITINEHRTYWYFQLPGSQRSLDFLLTRLVR